MKRFLFGVLFTSTLWLPIPAQAAIGLVQHTARDAGTATSSTLAFGSSNAAGNFIAVAIRAGRSGESLTVTDSRGNIYRQAILINVTLDTPTGDTLAIYFAENISGGANTVSISQSLSATLRFAILEYSGVATSASLEGTSAAQASSMSASSGNVATTTSDLLLGALMSANGATFSAGTNFTLQDQVPAAPNTKLVTEDRIQGITGSAAATATLSGTDVWAAAFAAFRPSTTNPLPDLRVTKTHGGSFVQGQSGATYTLSVSNIGMGPTVGTVTITDVLPAGLTSTSLSGAGWQCTLGTLTCTRNDTLAAGGSYSAITLAVSVAGNAPGSLTNNASVSGGGEQNTANNSASDVATISPSTDIQPPTAPGTLSATVSSDSRIDLGWTAATDNTGVTAYRIERCQNAGCTNFSEMGTQNNGPITGPLTASANPNYFQTANGTPIILNGSHSWNTLQDWGSQGALQPLDFTAFVDFLVSHGQNFTLLWRTELAKFCGLPSTATSPPDFTVGPHPWKRTGPGTASDGGLKFDLNQLDQTYFDWLRARVQALNNAGIYAGVYLYSGEWLSSFRCAQDGFAFTSSNNINGIDDGGSTGSMTMTSPNAITNLQDVYVRKVIDTLNDLHNVLWIVSEEAPADTTWWNAHQISQIRSYESGKPYHHPIGYAVLTDWQDSVITNSDADWIAPVATISPTTSCGTGTPRCKVNINDSDHSNFGMWNSSPQSNRNYAWQNFTSGNQVLFMDPYLVYYPRENRNLCVSPVNGICSGPDARWDNFRNNLGYILSYSRKLNLANVTPRSSLCSTGNCLAQTPSIGAEYLIYAPDGGSFTVNLSAMSSSRSLNMEWFNPSTGTTTTGSPIAAGSSARSFTPPFSGDAVLYLVDTAGHAGSAPTGTTYSDTGLTANTMYRYQVRATDAAGNLGPYSPIASATTAALDTQAPTAPGNLTVSVLSSSQINLVWPAANDNVGVTGYGIERCSTANCANFSTVGNTTGMSFNDSGLTPSTSYSYRVSATDAANNRSGYSNVGTAITAIVSSGISLIQHTGKDGGVTASSTVAFAGNNVQGNFIAVAIRAGQTGQTFTVSDTRGNTYRKASQINETADGMTVAIYYAENIVAGSNIVTVSDTFTNTLRFAIFEYSSVATANSLDTTTAAQGTNNAPNSGNATTTTAGDLIFAVVSTASPATFTAGPNLTIQERVPAVPNSKLLVEDQRPAPSGSVSARATLGTSDQWAALVAAFHAGGGNPGDLQPPTAPSSLAATAVSSTQINLSWTGSTDNVAVTGYPLERCSGASCTNFAALSAPSGTTYSDNGLTVGTAYNYRVSATDGAGNHSGFSNSAAATPTGAGLSISPHTSVLTPILSQQFTASGGSGGNVTWQVDGATGGTSASGMITAAGLYSPPATSGTHTVTATDQAQSANATAYVSNYPGTFTRDVDNLRTGLNSREVVLTPANVSPEKFGKLFNYSIDGVSDASPLYVASVSIPGKGLRNVVYVATEHDSVYAFDADGLQSTPLWQRSFINPALGITTVPPGDTGECCDISPEIGITGSPVIDAATNTLYVVAKTKEVSGGNANYVHRLHALDITTGAEKLGGPVVIQASVPGTGDGSSGGQVPFLALRENQRAALLLNNGVVYIAFAGHGDQPPYHGWILGYSASNLARVMAYNVTPDGQGGGVWQSGDGLATDSSGNIFFVTGNGTFDADAGGRNYGDSIVKLSPTGNVLDYFTPHDQAAMNASDLDLGSGGTILLPDQSGTHPHLALSAGKNGTIYVVDRDNMGHFRSGNDNQIVQSLVNIFPGGTFVTGNFKAPVYWNGRLYFSADADFIKSFQITNGTMSTAPSSSSSFVANYPGATLGASSNGNLNGILWAIQRVDQDPVGGTGIRGPGSLHAFDTTDLRIELYNSNQAAGARDALDFAAKWAAPLIANGKVFVATNGRLTAFGLLP